MLPVLLLLAPVDIAGQEAPSPLTLGSALGSVEDAFQSIVSVAVTSDGRWIVADEGDASVRVYDPSGRLLARFGGVGEGPGEFRHLGAASLTEDTLVVLDREGGKLVSFTLAGKMANTRPTDFSVSRFGFPERLIPISSGGLLLETASGCGFPRRDDADTIWRLLHLAPGKSEWRILHAVDRADAMAVYGRPPRSFCTVVDIPFRSTPMVAITSDGNVIYGDGVRPFFSRMPVADLLAMGSGGFSAGSASTVPIASVQPRPVTKRDRSAWLESATGNRSRREDPQWLTDALSEAVSSREAPAEWPAYDRMLLSDVGDVWLRRPPAGSATAEWLLVTVDGRTRGTVVLPSDHHLRAVRNGAAYSTGIGEWDEPHVVRTPVVIDP